MADDDRHGDTQDPQITAKLAQILANAPILFDRLGATARAGIVAGSPAAEDATAGLGHHTRIMAIDRLATGLEHLVIWHRLLTGGSQPIATHMTLIRSAMEGAGTSRWLFDPRLGSAERVSRGVDLLLEDYGNRRDFERDFASNPPAVKPPPRAAPTATGNSSRSETPPTSVGSMWRR